MCLSGSVIRCMRRLEELLRQMCQASKAIGNTELENKFAEGNIKINNETNFSHYDCTLIWGSGRSAKFFCCGKFSP